MRLRLNPPRRLALRARWLRAGLLALGLWGMASALAPAHGDDFLQRMRRGDYDGFLDDMLRTQGAVATITGVSSAALALELQRRLKRPKIPDDQPDTEHKRDCDERGAALWAKKQEYGRRAGIIQQVQPAIDEANKWNGAKQKIADTRAALHDVEKWVWRLMDLRVLTRVVAAPWEIAGQLLNWIHDRLWGLIAILGVGTLGSMSGTGPVVEKLGRLVGSLGRVQGLATKAAWAGGHMAFAMETVVQGDKCDATLKGLLGSIAETRSAVTDLQAHLNAAQMKYNAVVAQCGAEQITLADMDSLRSEILQLQRDYYNRCWDCGAPFWGDAPAPPDASGVPADWTTRQVGDG
jgi:hypothetical protein